MRIGDAKQTYQADEAIWTSSTQKFWFSLLLLSLLVFPFLANAYLLYLGCLVGIAVISTTGLNILTGFTGLISLGQAGFMGVGATRWPGCPSTPGCHSRLRCCWRG